MTSQQEEGASAGPPRRVPAIVLGSSGSQPADIQQELELAAPETQPDTRQHSTDCSTDGGAGAPPHPGFHTAAVPEDSAVQPESSVQPPPRAGRGGKQEPGRHLVRHALTADVLAAAAAEFGSDRSAAGHKIYALKQPELRSTFARVYRFETRSSNNSWMRSKLLKAVGLDATWIPEQPQTPQDDDLLHQPSQQLPEPGAAGAAAPDAAAGAQRRPVRKAALAHRPWQGSETASEDEEEHPKLRRKRAQRFKHAVHGGHGGHATPAASPSPRPGAAGGPRVYAGAAAAAAAAASASASGSTEDMGQAPPPSQGQSRKRQLPETGGALPQQPGKRPASPESAQSPAPPSAVAAAAFGALPPAQAQQLAAAVFDATAPWPSSGSGSTVQPLADAWPRMLAAAVCAGAPLPQQVAALLPPPFAARGAAAVDPATEAELVQLLLLQHAQHGQHAQRGPVQLQPAQWAAWAAREQPPPQQLTAAFSPGQLAMLGPAAPPLAQAWGGRQQLPLIAVMAGSSPQSQPMEQQALQQLAAARLQQGQMQQQLEAQQHQWEAQQRQLEAHQRQIEAQMLAARLYAPGQQQAAVPIRLAALPAAALGPAVRPPSPHDGQLQQAAMQAVVMQAARSPPEPLSPRAGPQQLGGAVAWLPAAWAAPAPQPLGAYAAASGGSSAPPGRSDVQRFREQQLELERRAQLYQREQEQAASAQYAQQAQQQQHQQHQHQQQQPAASPFAAFAGIAPADAQWPPPTHQLRGGPAAAVPPGALTAAAGPPGSPRGQARPAVPHHTLSADLHMLFSAYADGQLSLPAPPQGPS